MAMHHTIALPARPLGPLAAVIAAAFLWTGCGGNEVGDTPVSRCVPEGACPDNILETGIQASLGDPAAGAAIFTANCTRCHGEAGIGLADARRIDMSSPAWQASMRDSGIVATVRAGRGALMPAFTFTDQELRDILARIRDLVREGTAPQPGVQPTTPDEPSRGGY